jgi:hypothetical protein
VIEDMDDGWVEDEGDGGDCDDSCQRGFGDWGTKVKNQVVLGWQDTSPSVDRG